MPLDLYQNGDIVDQNTGRPTFGLVEYRRSSIRVKFALVQARNKAENIEKV